MLYCKKQQYYREVQWSPMSSKSGEEELLLNWRKLLGEAGATVCCSWLGVREKKGAQKTNTTGEGLTANLRWGSFSIKMSSLPLINIHNPGRKWGKAALGPSFPKCLPAEVNTLIRNQIHERKEVGFVSPGPRSSVASCSRLFSSCVVLQKKSDSVVNRSSAEKWLSLFAKAYS